MEGNKRKGSAMGESGSSSPKKKGASKLRNSIKSPRDKTQAESVMEGECWKMHKRFFHKWKKQYMVLTAEHLQIFDNYKVSLLQTSFCSKASSGVEGILIVF